MKLLSRLLISLLIGLIAIPLLAMPAQADGDEEASISLSPSSGHPGEEITVRGYDFDYREDVDIYYYRDTSTSSREKVATDRADSDGYFRVSFTIPESCSGDHKVYAYGDKGSRVTDYFTVEPGLEIDTDEGSVGASVIVTGTGFGDEEEDIELRYYLDSTHYAKVADDITADEDGSWEATFTIPASGKGSHKIDAKGDDSTLSDVDDVTFTVKPGISLSANEGYVGDSITVSGSGFASSETSIKVTYDDEQVGTSTTAAADGTWEVSFEVPASAKGSHEIDASGSSTSAADIGDKDFSIKPKMVLSPETSARSPGYVGTSLELSGSGFAAEKSVSIKYDGSQVATTTTDSKGSFPSTTFAVPQSKYGEHTVTVSDAAGDEFTATFVMESEAPPKPTLSAPANGSRIGLVRKQAPAFEWSAVEDESGVTYNLQVATDATFTQSVVLANGLSDNSYALAEEQALPYGSYYWRVKAIDGAENDSGWTTPYTFKSGLLPFWAAIAILALIVILIGVLIYLFAIRGRRYYD